MPCVNHPEKDVQSYCQHCGKPLCADCVRTTPTGQVFCESCFATAGQAPPGSVPPGAIPPFYPLPSYGPNPSAAAVLGLIPGVGAMYNGQLFKGLIHVVIFAVLVSITDHHGVFGIFIGAWILYQSFEAFQTAKARRDGTPLPDPFGLNELGSWLNLGGPGRTGPTGQNPPPAADPASTQTPPPYSAPYTGSWSGAYPPQPPLYAETWTGPEPYTENYPPGYIPPIPPVPPQFWRRREPIFAFVLIGLGVVFLLQSLGFVGHLMHYIWPFMLIALGVWMIMRRVGYTQGGPK